jgi:hypothetical protein
MGVGLKRQHQMMCRRVAAQRHTIDTSGDPAARNGQLGYARLPSRPLLEPTSLRQSIRE